MGTWLNIKENGWFDLIRGFYGKDFPVETRGILADFLEENALMLNYHPEKQDHRRRIILIYMKTLKQELNRLVARLPEGNDKEKDFIRNELAFMYKRTMEKQNEQIQATDPTCLFKAIQGSLRLEKETINNLVPGTGSGLVSTQTIPEETGYTNEVDNAMAAMDINDRNSSSVPRYLFNVQ